MSDQITKESPTGRTRRSPDGVFAGPGGVRQHGGMLPIYVCNQCDAEVVWATSKRTGRKYLANVSHGHLDQRFYIGANVHKCYPRWTNPLVLNDYYADLVFDLLDGDVIGLKRDEIDGYSWRAPEMGQ